MVTRRCRPFPPVRAFILSRIGFSIPTARRFSSNVANSRCRAFRYSILIKKKALPECALGENGTHEIDFSRHEDNLQATGDAGTTCDFFNF